MTYLILGLLFVAVFVFIAWRVIAGAPGNRSSRDAYVCPHCNEQHCDCHKPKS